MIQDSFQGTLPQKQSTTCVSSSLLTWQTFVEPRNLPSRQERVVLCCAFLSPPLAKVGRAAQQSRWLGGLKDEHVRRVSETRGPSVVCDESVFDHMRAGERGLPCASSVQLRRRQATASGHDQVSVMRTAERQSLLSKMVLRVLRSRSS